MSAIFTNSPQDWSSTTTTGTLVQWHSSAGTEDNTFQITNDPSDPVINGPFGNLAGEYWAEENVATGTAVFRALPPNSVSVCSAWNGNKNVKYKDYSVVWYNNDKNIFVFGDSTGEIGGCGGTSTYAACYDGGAPNPKPYGTPLRTTNVAALELNAIHWAIQRALSNGINPH
jgi:hypothetical protein